jgi:hypothetical protein
VKTYLHRAKKELAASISHSKITGRGSLMPCPSFEDLLLDYWELSEPEAERECLNLHISGCAECREYLETIAKLDARLLELYASVHVSPVFQKPSSRWSTPKSLALRSRCYRRC